MKIFTTVLLICLQAGSIFAQDIDIHIEGQFVGNSRFAKVVVQQFGLGLKDVAAMPIENEVFKLTAPASITPGVYRFKYSQSSPSDYIDIIINGIEKEIVFSIDLNIPERPVTFTASEVNNAWYSYQNQSNTQLRNIVSIQQLMANYSDKKAPIVVQSTAAAKIDIESYTLQRNTFLDSQGDSWAAKMVQNQAVYFTNPFDHPQLQDYYRQEHFWDGVDTTNPKLINTPLYSELIINYLQYYLGSDRGFSDDQIVEELTKCVDTILQKFGGHPITQKFALKYLQLGFKEIGQEELLQHIDQTYKTQILEFTSDTKEQSDFEKRMAGYATLKAGNLSPAATFTSPEGSSFDLKDIKNKYTVLAFWASWCPSCEEQMPLVETYAKAHTDVTVVAVSLDEDKDEFISAIKNYPSLTHSCDYTAWNSKIVEAYYIHASPTFIVLDDQQRIVGKYSSWEAAEQEL